MAIASRTQSTKPLKAKLKNLTQTIIEKTVSLRSVSQGTCHMVFGGLLLSIPNCLTQIDALLTNLTLVTWQFWLPATQDGSTECFHPFCLSGISFTLLYHWLAIISGLSGCHQTRFTSDQLPFTKSLNLDLIYPFFLWLSKKNTTFCFDPIHKTDHICM